MYIIKYIKGGVFVQEIVGEEVLWLKIQDLTYDRRLIVSVNLIATDAKES